MSSYDRCINHAAASAEGLAERQRALDALLATLQKEQVCLSCGCAAGLYVAAVAAVRELNVPLDEFLELASAIYRDADRQRNGQLTVTTPPTVQVINGGN